MPAGWDEFTVTELASVLAESRGAAEGLLDLAYVLEVKLPGTKAAFRDGTLRESKAEIIARATTVLDPAEARAARVQRWAEDSGNAALMGRELPPAEALAADQRITAWARELKAAGLDGSMDELRARAYLDILLDKDSRPSQDATGGQDSADGKDSADGQDSGGPQDPRGGSGGGPGPAGPGQPAGPQAGSVPAGFVGRVNLTIPLATLLDLADRASTAHREATAPGGCGRGEKGQTCWSRSIRSPWTNVTTGMRPRATIPASSYAT
jgi:hypothetical protein